MTDQSLGTPIKVCLTIAALFLFVTIIFGLCNPSADRHTNKAEHAAASAVQNQ